MPITIQQRKTHFTYWIKPSNNNDSNIDGDGCNHRMIIVFNVIIFKLDLDDHYQLQYIHHNDYDKFQ